MSGPRSPGNRGRAERGAISWVTLLLLLLLGGGAYMGWVWAPLYFELYTVKQVVRDFMNQAIKNPDDEGQRVIMARKIRALEQVDGVDAGGHPTRVPAFEFDERQITWERDEQHQPPMLRIAFEYERRVVYPFIDRVDVKIFQVDLTTDLTRADWGSAR